MKFKKKAKIIISLAIGTVMFTTTAIAQVMSKSGYDRLKDSAKYTVESCFTKLSSYTMDTSIILKDNGDIIYSKNSLAKVDVKNGSTETVTNRLEGSKEIDDYNYSDKKGNIFKNSEQDIYYVRENSSPQNTVNKNPFKEKEAADVEKIVDALVGNLKDAVVVTENSDGTKTLSGSLTESQIPALINAVVSLQSKSQLGNGYNGNSMPKITNDVFVKEVKGKMVTTKEGFIQSVLGSGVISGKEENGVEHKLTLEILVKITGVNSTKVSKPDLTGKKIEKSVEQNYSKLSNPEKYIGKYKTDLVIEKEGKFEKIGEKIIDITAIDEKNISGRYYEEYTKGYEEYAVNKKDLKFNAEFDKDQFSARFNVEGTSRSNIEGFVSIDVGSAKIYFNTGENNYNGKIISDDQYSKIFD